MRFVYASRISENIARTPEGYLICRNVPIARVGYQEYRGDEIGVSADRVRVYRSPEEVFAPAALASFEGKTVTDTHPPQFVGPDNEAAYNRGHAQNIRRGTADDGTEAVLGDLVIKDAVLIEKILNGLREISCGYDCKYRQLPDGVYEQYEIFGNHIAVVPNGRAGDAIRIRDEQTVDAAAATTQTPIRKERPKSMRVQDWKQKIIGLGLKAHAQDAEPEEIAEAAKAVSGNKDADGSENTPPPEKKGEGEMADAKTSEAMCDAVRKAVTDGLQPLNDALKILLDSEIRRRAKDEETAENEKKAAEEANAKEEADKKAKDAAAEEEAKKKAAESQATSSEDADLIPVPTAAPSERPNNPIPGADQMRDALLMAKPLVAATNDAAAIAKWNQAWRALNPKPVTSDAGYGALLQTGKPSEVLSAEARAGAMRTADAAAKDVDKYFDEIAAVRNKMLSSGSKGVN